MVSSPAAGTFVHVAHVGFNYRGEVEASDALEPGWAMMLEEMQGYSVTTSAHTDEDEDRNFVDGFIAGVNATGPPPVPDGDAKPHSMSFLCFCLPCLI